MLGTDDTLSFAGAEHESIPNQRNRGQMLN
jgi:hypothetical protein